MITIIRFYNIFITPKKEPLTHFLSLAILLSPGYWQQQIYSVSMDLPVIDTLEFNIVSGS